MTNVQRKHLIAFTLATIFMLLGFNIINNYFHKKERAALIDNKAVVVEDDNEGNNEIAELPLGKQPKAILDNATTQIEQAQEVEQQRLEQMDNAH